MKLSISNIAWSKENDEEMYKYISESGFNGIEIAPTRILEENPYNRLDEAKVFSYMLKGKYGLNISSMQSIWFGKTQKIFNSEQERNELLDYTKKAIEFANKINCSNLVFGCPKNRCIQGNKDYHIAIQFFREIGKIAQENDTTFSIEPNPTIYNTNFINTTQEALKIVKEIDCDAVKVNVDLGTILFNNESIEELKENIQYINHIHISEPNLEKIQKREIHKQLYNILVESNYQKYVSIEMKNQDNLQMVKEIIDYVKGVFL